MNDLQKLWSNTLSLLREEIMEAPFNSFIKPTKPVSIDYDQGIIVLLAESDYIKERLSDRYCSSIESALKDACGQDLKAEFICQKKNVPLYTDARPEQEGNFPFNPKYTFDSFIIGKGNNLAHAAASAVAHSPALIYNPLFIYGAAGLGKTHLLNAIANYIIRNHPSLKVLFVSSETFTNELVESIKNNTTVAFRNKFRNIDVLIVDDIQFLAKKEGTQEEFFHTFNALHENNKQIIISSDRPPKEIQTLEDRLRSRFEWSLITDIQPPDIETRIAILQKKAEMVNLQMTPELLSTLEYIAGKIQYNVRELEGAMIRISASAQINKVPITKELAKEVLKDVYVEKERKVTAQLIKEATAKYFNIKVIEIESAKRSRNLAFPRQIAMYICRTLTGQSLPKIGEEFGNRDHTTVLHACDKISAEIKVNATLNNIVQNLISELESRSE